MSPETKLANDTAHRSFATLEELKQGLVQQENAWVVFTVIGASILITLIAVFALYDLCNRFREFISQQIFDGGPPASPAHNATYTLQIQVDEASPSFDTKKSVLKVEFLDSLNQFITNVVVPCFLFKFKSQSRNVEALESPPVVQPFKIPELAMKQDARTYKSLSAYYESWQNLTRSNLLSFSMVRRLPMQNLTSVRLTHDCYAPDSYLTLKHVIVRDDLQRESSKVDLQNKPLKAVHICPPSSFQVFPAEPLENPKEVQDSKSFIQIMTVPELVALLIIYYQLGLFFSPMTYEWLHGVSSVKSCLLLGLLVAAFTITLASTLLVVYLLLRQGTSDPFRVGQPSTILLVGCLILCAILCFLAVFKIFELKVIYENFALHLVLIFLVAGTTLTLLLILLVSLLAIVKINFPAGTY